MSASRVQEAISQIAAGFAYDSEGGSDRGLKLGIGTADLIGFHGATPIAQQSGGDQAATGAATGAAAPAGGTGATEGAYDTAANRNSMITLVNETRTLANECRTLVNELRQDLVDLGLIAGA